MPNRVQVINEASTNHGEGRSNLCLQWCQYVYENGTSDYAYRFIWRKPNGNMLPSRGQAMIPSFKVLEQLVSMAKQQGWGNYDGNNI